MMENTQFLLFLWIIVKMKYGLASPQLTQKDSKSKRVSHNGDVSEKKFAPQKRVRVNRRSKLRFEYHHCDAVSVVPL